MENASKTCSIGGPIGEPIGWPRQSIFNLAIRTILLTFAPSRNPRAAILLRGPIRRCRRIHTALDRVSASVLQPSSLSLSRLPHYARLALAFSLLPLLLLSLMRSARFTRLALHFSPFYFFVLLSSLRFSLYMFPQKLSRSGSCTSGDKKPLGSARRSARGFLWLLNLAVPVTVCI